MQRWLLALLSAALVTAATTCGAADAAQEAAAAINPRYLLQDGKGRAVSNEDFPGRFQLITFGYTYCPDICPTDLQQIGLAIDKLGTAGAAVQPLFISVDPERDTMEVLARYVVLFHPRLIGLTGTPQQIKAAASAYKAYYARYKPPEGGDYVIDHTGFVYLMDGTGAFRGFFPPGTSADRMVEIIRPLLPSDPEH